MTIIYLYVKTHQITGLKYLGKTKNTNPHKYPGSGKRWIHHLKKHGYAIDTEIIKECSSNDEIKKWGLYYSKLWDVVNSDDWANIKAENGDGGIHTTETKAKISKSNTGQKRSAETKKKMSIAKKGKPLSDEHKEKLRLAKQRNPSKGMTGKNHSVESKEKMKISASNMSDETKKKMSIAKKGKPLSDEHKEKLRLALTGKPKSEDHKKKLIEAKRKNKS